MGHAYIEFLEREIRRLKKSEAQPVAWRVCNMMRQSVPSYANVEGHVDIPTEYLYSANRETDAVECAKIMRGEIQPLYTHPPTPSCLSPTHDSEPYYFKGKDANWVASLSDDELAETICCAAQALNDTGFGDDSDKWMHFRAVMSIAAERIKKLSASSEERK